MKHDGIHINIGKHCGRAKQTWTSPWGIPALNMFSKTSGWERTGNESTNVFIKKSESNAQYRFPSMNLPSSSTTGNDHMHLDAFSHPTVTWDLYSASQTSPFTISSHSIKSQANMHWTMPNTDFNSSQLHSSYYTLSPCQFRGTQDHGQEL
jgi:hypothetical protein